MNNEGAPHATGAVLARPDVSVLRTGQGAWIGVGSASFTVKGAAAYTVVSALLERSDGDRTGHDLVSRFPDRARPGVWRVLDALVANRCLTVLDAPMGRLVADRGPAAEWLIPYLSQLTGDPVRALDRVRATVLHVYGRPRRLGHLRRLLEDAESAGMRTVVHDAAEDAAPQEERLPRPGADLALIDADGIPRERTVRIQDALLGRGVQHGVVGEAGGRRWILWSDEESTGCWACLHRYGETAEREAPPPTASPAPDDAVAAVLLHAVCGRGAGLGGHAAVSLPLGADPPTVKPHPAWPVAGCRCHRAPAPPAPDGGGTAQDEPVRRNIVGPDDDPRLDDAHQGIIDTLAGWTDEFFGPFRYLDGGDLAQIPFGQARATVLAGGAGACRVRGTTAATLSSREALYQAALNGLELFALEAGHEGALEGGTAPPGGSGPHVGAGWTLDEAVYRALLRSALARSADGAEEAPVDPDDPGELGDGECAAFARYIRRGAARTLGLGELRWTATRLPNGLHRATGSDTATGRPVAHGAGACRAEAVATALLRLVNDGALVPLNPHFTTWAEVWRHIAPPAWTETTGRALPFARNKARIVEVA